MIKLICVLASAIVVIRAQSQAPPPAAGAQTDATANNIPCNQPGQFPKAQADNGQCETVCANLIARSESIFSYGFCAPINENASCNMCGKTYRVWTTVFIFVVMSGAVAVLLFILPICAATCHSCLTVKKDVKRRKNEQVGGPVMDVQSKQLATMQRGGGGAPAYNPYAYWPYYGQQ